MTFFSFLHTHKIALPKGKKILKEAEYTTLVEAEKLIEKMKADEEKYKQKAVKKGEKKGFNEGLKQFNKAIAHLEEEIETVRKEMENAIIPLALTAVKKIIGKELEAKNITVVDIIATALKGISHHKKVKLFVNKVDFDLIDSQKPRLKDLFEHLQSLTLAIRDSVPQGECVVETESGIINISLDQQLTALEKAFKSFLQKEKTV